MSRVIIKSLPSGIKEEELRVLFGSIGHITDCSLKYTKDGVFRKFAFIGYQTIEDAEKAVKHFHKSFIKTARIKVELACDMGDSAKPRAWSKYSTDSSAFKRLQNKVIDGDTSKEQKGKDKTEEKDKTNKVTKKKDGKKDKSDKMDALLGDVKEDPAFEEFLQLHKARINKSTWSNDEPINIQKVKGEQGSISADSDGEGQSHEEEVGQSGDDDDDDESSQSEESEMSRTDETLVKESPVKKPPMAAGSDMDFLKSKMSANKQLFSDSENSSDDDDGNSDDKSDDSSDDSGVNSDDKSASDDTSDEDDDSKTDSDENSDDSSSGDEDNEDHKKVTDGDEGEITHYIVKMRGLPSNVKESQIREFFKPIEPTSIKIPKNAKGKKAFCIATVEFPSESSQDSAMRRNKNFIGPKRIFLHKSKVMERQGVQKPLKPWEIKLSQQTGSQEETESIAESGRLYVRNLAYVCTEQDLEELFKPYGPLSEVHLPIDSFTKKVKGFAFITYMIPEHAVQAYTELDGKVFQGRLLHILPAQPKKEEEIQITDDMSFKQKKELKQKAQANSSHNWNSLFLGANAVADVMAQRYQTAKSNILDADQKQSLGVRMALGETQIVAETRDFLLENGVVLDAFSQADGPRSKTTILVKNLPAGTQAKELKALFSRFGELGRLVLPPSGITAIVEMTEETEAKIALRNLAYTKFKHVPLYLEWAPVGVFKPTQKSVAMDTREEAEIKQEVESADSDDDEPEPDSTLFVKNLNFETTEESMKEHFKKCGPLHYVSVAKKKDMKNPGKFLSMGYGFIQYKKKSSAQKALKKLQHSTLDTHQVELKMSNRATVSKDVKSPKKKQDTKKKQTTSKILVRNIPFEGKEREVRELFSVFGELKSVRLPKKLSGTGSHRGFAFVDFMSKQDAKRAFDALCHSTHLYGRRLVLEWADTEETVDQLRKKTAQHYHEGPVAKRLKKSAIMDRLKGIK